MQAERDAGGSIIQHWKPSEIKNALVPLLPFPTQKQIADDLQQSAALQKQSKELLEKAKQEVEREIEKP